MATSNQANGNPMFFWLDVASATSSWLFQSDGQGSSNDVLPSLDSTRLHAFNDVVAGSGEYKLFIPPGLDGQKLPMVVMLHGCSQGPDDFAVGTAMNDAAAVTGFAVMYPAQSRSSNRQLCWNWFDVTHQHRGAGEPALLAAMTRHAIGHHGMDPERIFVAGLSAGGAMAAILGEAYPDVYAAVGVHSGLAAHAALDMSTAFTAMQGRGGVFVTQPSGMPTIVFHGDADSTVHSRNGEQVIEACAGSDADVESVAFTALGGRDATRSLHRTVDGHVVAEHWVVHGASHAWSGGSNAGSFADARGPDASAEMLRFFSEHPRRPAMAER